MGEINFEIILYKFIIPFVISAIIVGLFDLIISIIIHITKAYKAIPVIMFVLIFAGVIVITIYGIIVFKRPICIGYCGGENSLLLAIALLLFTIIILLYENTFAVLGIILLSIIMAFVIFSIINKLPSRNNVNNK